MIILICIVVKEIMYKEAGNDIEKSLDFTSI